MFTAIQVDERLVLSDRGGPWAGGGLLNATAERLFLLRSLHRHFAGVEDFEVTDMKPLLRFNSWQ